MKFKSCPKFWTAFFLGMKLLIHILRIIVGLVFILSGILKLYPIEPFELTLVDIGIANWTLAPFFARLIIAFEFFLGLLLILNIGLKSFTYKATQITLVVFTLYLFYQLYTEGNDINCGCFGTLIEFSPIESIIKNIVLMSFLFIVRKHNYKWKFKWVLPVIGLLSLSTPLILNPIGFYTVQVTELNQKVDLSGLPPLYKTGKKVDFETGKKLIIFLSVKCPHCKNAAYKLSVMDRKYDINNVYYVIGGDEDGMKKFMKDTKSDFPVILFDNNDFFKYSGGELPAVIYIDNGVLKKKWTGSFFDIDELLEVIE